MTRRPAALAPGAAAVLVTALAIPLLSASGGSPPGPAAATAGDGALRGWGFNGAGQLGDGSTTSSDVPVKVRLPAGTAVTSARAGCDHTLALTSAGKVLAWGRNEFGQLGNGTTASSDTPVRVKLPAGTRITAVRAGCSHSLALTSKGKVLAWGSNEFGQLGDGTSVDRTSPVRVKLPAGTKVSAISAGQVHNLAITANGKALAWGFNGDGELGDGSTMARRAPVRVALPARTKVKAVAAGSLHSLAITTLGKVLGWGLNGNGELGDGTTTDRSTPVQALLPPGTRVLGLSGGCSHSLALTTKRTVLAWGENDFGQLGDGTVTDRDTPTQVALTPGTKIKAISAGCDHNLARTANGQVLAWGDNRDGELGNGTTAGSHTPVRVRLPDGLTATAIGAGPLATFSLVIVPAAEPSPRPRRPAAADNASSGVRAPHHRSGSFAARGPGRRGTARLAVRETVDRQYHVGARQWPGHDRGTAAGRVPHQ